VEVVFTVSGVLTARFRTIAFESLGWRCATNLDGRNRPNAQTHTHTRTGRHVHQGVKTKNFDLALKQLVQSGLRDAQAFWLRQPESGHWR
jgi:hypothetical protein